ncbi:hypothetical protein FACS1894169_04530 [Bacteroidia bacterium]|nr:hypothetical protein FACS1894169_04530 [Bacteroidia bacterium]
MIKQISLRKSNKIIIGRDARISGEMVSCIVKVTLMGMGFDVVDLGLRYSILGQGAAYPFLS